MGEQVQAAIATAGGSATVGVATADGDLSHGDAEARRCLDTLLTLGRTGEVSDPAGLGLARLLLGENGPAQLGDFLAATLGPVLAYDAQRGTGLVDTLEAWFATGGSARESAARLHVHPNTVAQRLARVGELLGPDWRDQTQPRPAPGAPPAPAAVVMMAVGTRSGALERVHRSGDNRADQP